MRRAFSCGLFIAAGAGCRPAAPDRVCAIDMGSNSFRRIVGTFADGNYTEFRIDSQRRWALATTSRRHGDISEAKLAQISGQLSAFSRRVCERWRAESCRGRHGRFQGCAERNRGRSRLRH